MQGLNVIDLEDLIEDIKVYSEIEDETHIEFWKVLTQTNKQTNNTQMFTHALAGHSDNL